jgi:hypothetical protein
MNIKTATRIAIIGISIHFVLALFNVYGMRYLYQTRRYLPIVQHLPKALWALSYIILNGSIILFLAVFYSKQKDSTESRIDNLL